MSDDEADDGPLPPPTRSVALLRWAVIVAVAVGFLLQIARGECPVY